MGLARLAASAVALLLLAIAPALAGDRALLNIMGYSEDGQYLAFEEYGVHDGSGGAYSNIYVVNLADDTWAKGVPFSVDAVSDEDPEAKPLTQVRAEALAKAQPTLKPLKLNVPAEIISLLGEGVTGTDGKSMAFSTPSCCGPGATQDDHLTLNLTTAPVKSDDDGCADMSPVGYRLELDDGTDKSVLHQDSDTLPKSRGCTVDYRIYAVIQPFEQNYGRVAIISSYPFGFEGPDRRFLAVPIDNP
jgi:predicted secreted protein